jgi:hypothetical protein
MIPNDIYRFRQVLLLAFMASLAFFLLHVSTILLSVVDVFIEGNGGDFWPDKWQFKEFDELQTTVGAKTAS